MKFSIAFLIYVLLTLAACSVSLREQKSKDLVNDTKADARKPENHEQLSNCSYFCTLSWELSEINPGLYNVILKWKKTSELDGKIRFFQESKLIGSVEVGKEFYEVSQILSNENLRIQMEWISQKDGLVDFRDIVIDGPKELIVRDNLILQSDLVFSGERVYFYKNSKLVTNGFKVNIQAETLQSDMGEILTFENGAKAVYGQNGRSGAEIRIQITDVQGDLTVNMRGENGGDGLNGESWAYPAASGQVGDRGDSFYESCLRPTHLDSINDRSICRGRYYCSRESIGSTAGQNGQQGKAGSNGLPGGDSGLFDMKVLGKNNLNIKVNTQAGIGGQGGLGGAGQMGGLGGPEIKGVERCKDHPAAPNGLQGPMGLNGQSGSSGIKQSACITYDNSQICY